MQTQIDAMSGGAELIEVDAKILAGIEAAARKSMGGSGGALAWPALLRKLDRRDPSYRE